MTLNLLLKHVAQVKTVHELDLLSREFAGYGDQGVDALVVRLTDRNTPLQEVLLFLCLLGLLRATSTPKVAGALERVLLTRTEPEAHNAVLPVVLLHADLGREDAELAVAAFLQRGEFAAQEAVMNARLIAQKG